MLETITHEVGDGEKVAITRFGSLEQRIREARWVRNPRAGGRMKGKRSAVPKFTPGADLRAVISGVTKPPKLGFQSARSTGRGGPPGPPTVPPRQEDTR